MIINVHILDNNIETSANVHVMCSSLSLGSVVPSLCSTVDQLLYYVIKYFSEINISSMVCTIMYTVRIQCICVVSPIMVPQRHSALIVKTVLNVHFISDHIRPLSYLCLMLA